MPSSTSTANQANKLTTTELLLPADSFEKLHAAIDFDADAAYSGQPRYILRALNNEFSTLDVFNKAVRH
jgi:putative protease